MCSDMMRGAPDVDHFPALHELRLAHNERRDHSFALFVLQLVGEHCELLVAAAPAVQLVHRSCGCVTRSDGEVVYDTNYFYLDNKN